MRRLSRPIAWGVCVALIAAGPAAGKSGDDYADRMAAEHADDTPVSSGMAEAEPAAETTSSSVVYATIDERPVSGYLARPAGDSGALPGVVVIHEWWGLNDNVRAMADRIAGEGYTALAVDLYEGSVAATPAEARELMGASVQRRAALASNLRQAIDYLKTSAEATAVGTIGWCFGGGWSLGAALANPGDVDATVIYYGRLVTDPEQLAVLSTPILGLFGSEDRGIPVSSVREFEAALDALGKPAEIHVYEGANHAFANPSGGRYDEAAATDAWARTTAFFDAHLR